MLEREATDQQFHSKERKSMTVLHSGATQEYSDNFNKAFGAKSPGSKAGAAKPGSAKPAKAAKPGSTKRAGSSRPVPTAVASKKVPARKKASRKSK
jgi:hypothetical protein